MMNQPLNPQALQQLKQVMNTIQMAQNPQFALNQFLMNNPQLSNIMNLVKSGGGNLQQVFFNLAKQKGVDPQYVLNMLQNK